MSERDGFLSRWSRRKHDVAAGRSPEPAPPTGAADPPVEAPVAQDVQPAPPAPLPPVESLTADSDFTPFMAKDVDAELKRSALKTLFRDERFNVMDGLDVYIDDYTKPAPIPAAWYERMTQLAGLGDVPAREAAEAKAAQDAEAQAAKEASASVDALPAAPALPIPDPASQGTQPDDSRDVLDASARGDRQ